VTIRVQVQQSGPDGENQAKAWAYADLVPTVWCGPDRTIRSAVAMQRKSVCMLGSASAQGLSEGQQQYANDSNKSQFNGQNQVFLFHRSAR
jgi:hypothetical protein